MGNRSSKRSRSSSKPSTSEMVVRKKSSECRDLDQIWLSGPQLVMINKLWQQAKSKGPHEPGKSILQGVFMRHPEVKGVFITALGDKWKGGLADSVLNEHAQRFTKTMEEVIKGCNKPDTNVSAKLRHLGAKHVAFRDFGFHPKYWQTFAEIMVEKSLLWGRKTQRNFATYDAWGEICLFIVRNMEEGYKNAFRMEGGNVTSRSESSNKFLSVPDSTARPGTISKSPLKHVNSVSLYNVKHQHQENGRRSGRNSHVSLS